MEQDLSYACPSCGQEVRVGSTCPGCSTKRKPARQKPKAARIQRSWQQDPSHDGLDLPDEDFDYDEFVAREFHGAPHRRLGVKWYWWAIGVGVLILFSLGAIRVYWG